MSSVSSILPTAGVEFLRCSTSASGFKNVYEHGTDAYGNVRYVAKVKMGGRLRVLPGGRSSMPHISAAAVVEWYRSRFGDEWIQATRFRKFNPRKVWYSRSRGGWLAAVWLWGKREEVCRTNRRGMVPRHCQPTVFPTRLAAIDGCIGYAKRRWGLLWQLALWRA